MSFTSSGQALAPETDKVFMPGSSEHITCGLFYLSGFNMSISTVFNISFTKQVFLIR